MRGQDMQQAGLFSDFSLERGCRRRARRDIIPHYVESPSALSLQSAKLYIPYGSASTPPEKLLRALLAEGTVQLSQ